MKQEKPASDRDRIAAAFKALRRERFSANMNLNRSNGRALIASPPDGAAPRIVFYTRDDAAAFDHRGNLSDDTLYLSHDATTADAQRIVAVLREHGLNAKWNG